MQRNLAEQIKIVKTTKSANQSNYLKSIFAVHLSL
ncbi:hypothetical protein HCMG_00977 [Helicobacter canadensis MIT 98-5491]|nr:hypothetical protein HCMG_00977 [Helicobacter canadensis MIT 98-5491]